MIKITGDLEIVSLYYPGKQPVSQEDCPNRPKPSLDTLVASSEIGDPTVSLISRETNSGSNLDLPCCG